VFAAHCLTAGIPFATREGYGPFPISAGEVPLGLLYTHAQFYVDKMKTDLKSVGVWGLMSHATGVQLVPVRCKCFMWLKQLMCYVDM